MLGETYEGRQTAGSDGSFLKIYLGDDIFEDFTVDIFLSCLSADDSKDLEVYSAVIGC
jgi:hypothetical protein